MSTRTRRQFLAAAGSTLAASAMSASESEPAPLLRFGLLTDCQYADLPPAGVRFYRESPRKLADAIAELNELELAFTFHLGDLIDRDMKSFDTILPIAATLKSPLHHLLGNHDFDGPDDLKAKVPGKLGLTETYYRLRHSGVRFLILDTTDVSTYRYPEGTPATRKAQAELDRLRTAGDPSANPWNSAVGPRQLTWLKKELTAATAAGEPVLVLGHHPIAPAGAHNAWNHKALLALLKAHPCVKAYLNGHNHAGAYINSDGLHCLTLDGMLDTKDRNAFAHAAVFPDRLEVTGFGRQESHSLRFRQGSTNAPGQRGSA